MDSAEDQEHRSAIAGDNRGTKVSLAFGTKIFCPETDRYGTIGGFARYRDGSILLMTTASVVCSDNISTDDDREQTVNSNIYVVKATNRNIIIGNVFHCYGIAALIKIDENTASVCDDRQMAKYLWDSSDFKDLSVSSFHPKSHITIDEFKTYDDATFCKIKETGLTCGRMTITGRYLTSEIPSQIIDNDWLRDNHIKMTIETKEDGPFCHKDEVGAFCYKFDRNDQNIRITPFGLIRSVTDSGQAVVQCLLPLIKGLDLEPDELFRIPVPDIAKDLAICSNISYENKMSNKHILGNGIQTTDTASVDDIKHYIQGFSKERYAKPKNMKVMFVGGEGTGKTCLCKTLLNIANPKSCQAHTERKEALVYKYTINMDSKSHTASSDYDIIIHKLQAMQAQENIQAMIETIAMPYSKYQDKGEHIYLTDPNNLAKPEPKRDPDGIEKTSIAKTSDGNLPTLIEFPDDVKQIINGKAANPESSYYATFLDLCGSDEYYTMQKHFFTNDTVFVVVFNLMDCLSSDQNTSRNEFAKISLWLKVIASDSIANTESNEKEGTPPIILIGTHLDQLKCKKQERNRCIYDVCEKLFGNQELRPILEKHVQRLYTISNLDEDDKTFEQIWDAILSAAPLQSQWDTTIPSAWLERERVLVGRKNSGIRIQTFQEIKEINRNLESCDNSDNDVMQFLRYMHLNGSIIVCKEDDMHAAYIILDPPWLMDAFRMLKSKFQADSESFQSEWERVSANDELPTGLFDKRWNTKKEGWDMLRNIMDHFGLFVTRLPVDVYEKANQGVNLKDSHEGVERPWKSTDPAVNIVTRIFQFALRCEQLDVLTVIQDDVCQGFKCHVDSIQKYLLHTVWIGYAPIGLDAEKKFSNLRIVAICNETPLMLLNEFLDIQIIWRKNDSISGEARMLLEYEDINTNIGNEIPNKIAKDLFKVHSNLTICHPSSVKSMNYSTSKPAILRKPCIALYCRIKGVIPLGEKAFDKKIGDLEIDVREGFCIFFTGDKVQPGAPISCKQTNNQGTIGPFVKFKNGCEGFVTAAHVVTNSTQRRFPQHEKQRFLNTNTNEVFQQEKAIGKVVDWCFQHSNHNEMSIDAALVELYESTDTTEEFPYKTEETWNIAGYDTEDLPKICQDRVIRHEEILHEYRRSDILKYGISTDITLGSFILDGASVRIYDKQKLTFGTGDDSETVEMYGLLGIAGRNKQAFSSQGDSGSLCCLVDTKDDKVLHPFGMIIAGDVGTGITFAIYLEYVFQKFDTCIPITKPLPLPNQDVDKTVRQHTKAIKQIQSGIMGLDKKVDKLDTDVNSKLDQITQILMSNVPQATSQSSSGTDFLHSQDPTGMETD